MKLGIAITIMILMSGCLSSDTVKTDVVLMGEEESYLHSYQFNNTAPMGFGNQTTAPVNATNVSLYLHINMSAQFHEPLAWDQGFVNVTILDENETVLWSNQTSGGQIEGNITLSNHTGNLTLQVLAEGSDNPADSSVADWYVIRYNLTYTWRVI